MEGNNSMNCHAVILAAGKGTRMKSELPKVLHKVAGKALVSYVIEACRDAGIQKPLLVVGHGSAAIRESVGDAVSYCEQKSAAWYWACFNVRSAVIEDKKGMLLVMCGDAPLIEGSTLKDLCKYFYESGAVCTVLSADMKNPYGLRSYFP